MADADAENMVAVLALDEAKQELRVDADDADQDDLIQGHVDAAIAYVAKRTGLPLAEKAEIVWVNRPCYADSSIFIGRHATCPELRWWTPECGELRLDPDGGPVTVDAGTVDAGAALTLNMTDTAGESVIVLTLTDPPGALGNKWAVVVADGAGDNTVDREAGARRFVIRPGLDAWYVSNLLHRLQTADGLDADFFGVAVGANYAPFDNISVRDMIGVDGGERAAFTGGSDETSALGRYDAGRGVLWPPSGGWPDVLTGSQLRISVRRRIAAADVDRSLKQAVVLVARQLYEGYPEVRPTAALNVLINPHVEYWR